MSARTPHRPPAALPEGTDIDALYGLEPVFEPSEAAGSGSASADTPFEPVQCPYCGEQFETAVDLSAGSASYIEDCQVCCQPIEMTLEVDDAGALKQLSARRGD